MDLLTNRYRVCTVQRPSSENAAYHESADATCVAGFRCRLGLCADVKDIGHVAKVEDLENLF
jgi:methylphosphotriester-DNA--protein-cysteine methyltransferase